MAGDILSIENDEQSGEPLIQPVMRDGRRGSRRRQRLPKFAPAPPPIWRGCPSCCAGWNRMARIRYGWRTH